jgi:hypothetical protein
MARRVRRARLVAADPRAWCPQIAPRKNCAGSAAVWRLHGRARQRRPPGKRVQAGQDPVMAGRERVPLQQEP